jgi:hypothetical protein
MLPLLFATLSNGTSGASVTTEIPAFGYFNEIMRPANSEKGSGGQSLFQNADGLTEWLQPWRSV